MRHIEESTERGFTLVELLIVIVVVGILAAIAIPKYSQVRNKSFIAAVRSDLRSLASHQEIYHSNNHVYAADLGTLNLTLSKDISLSVNEATGTGWAATATHVALAKQCGLYFGSASSSNAAPATKPGVVACQP